jgi:hypothetical protein
MSEKGDDGRGGDSPSRKSSKSESKERLRSSDGKSSGSDRSLASFLENLEPIGGNQSEIMSRILHFNVKFCRIVRRSNFNGRSCLLSNFEGHFRYAMQIKPKPVVGTSSIYPKATYDKMMKRLAELEKDWVDTDVAEIRKLKAEHFARLEKEMEVGKSTESKVEGAVNVDKEKQHFDKEKEKEPEGNEKGTIISESARQKPLLIDSATQTDVSVKAHERIQVICEGHEEQQGKGQCQEQDQVQGQDQLREPQLQQQPDNYLVGYWKATFDGVSLNF